MDTQQHPLSDCPTDRSWLGSMRARFARPSRLRRNLAWITAVAALTSAVLPTAFAANTSLNVNLDQCANLATSDCEWQNGNLNGNNSAYHEGDVVPFRLAIEGLEPGTHTIHINYDFMAGDVMAYDFLATYDATESVDECAAGGGGVSSLCPALGTVDTEPFPSDPFVEGGQSVADAEAFSSVTRLLTMYGGTIDSITGPVHSGDTGDFIVTFTTTGGAAFFLWGGHLAQGGYWKVAGQPNGAAEISGAPWHMRTQQLDDSGNKNQDRSIQPSAIVSARVSLTKTPDAALVSAGDKIGFTLTVSAADSGSADVEGVVLTDTLPTTAGTSWSIAPGVTGCAITDGVLTCNFGTIAEGTSKSVHVESATTAASCGLVNNSAHVVTSNDGTADATAQITVQCPDVSIVKTADSGTISAGDTAAFTIVVTSNGPGTAKGVTLSDTLPAGIDWVINPAVDGCSITAGTLACNFGDLAAGQSRTVRISGVTDAADCGILSNTAGVTATNEAAAATSNNSSTATITVNCAAIAISKVADAATVDAGEEIGFIITVTNNGAGTAKDVTLTDDLPAGLTWSIDPAVDGCSITVGALTCNFGDLAAAATRSVHVVATTDAADCGTITNRAAVSTSNNGSGEASATVRVDCPDVTVTKSADDDTINAGETAAFTIIVTNAGAGTAKGVTLSDTLPAGITWTEDSDDCSITDGVLSCNFGDLGPGETQTIKLSGPTDTTDCGVLNNTSTVASSNEAAAAQGNNSSTARITVNCPGSITITKIAQGYRVFTFRFTGQPYFQLGDGESKTFPDLVPGDYVVSEDAADGFFLKDLVCSGGQDIDIDKANRKATIHLGAEENVICTFTNAKGTTTPPPPPGDDTGGTTTNPPAQNVIDVLGDQVQAPGQQNQGAAVADPAAISNGALGLQELPRTGMAAGQLMALGLTMIALGVFALAASRRRQTAEQ